MSTDPELSDQERPMLWHAGNTPSCPQPLSMLELEGEGLITTQKRYHPLGGPYLGYHPIGQNGFSVLLINSCCVFFF